MTINHVTAVPEPSTIGLLLALFALAWLVACVVLLSKSRTRVAGIVVLTAPLALVVAAAFWWFYAGFSVAPQRDWQPHQVTRTGIHLEADPGVRGDMASGPAPTIESDESIVFGESDSAFAKAATPRSDMIVFILLAVLLLGGLIVIVGLLAFPKTRVAGIALLAIGVPAVLVLAGLGMFFTRYESMQTPARISISRGNARTIVGRDAVKPGSRLPDTGIPVDTAEKDQPKSTKPSPKPPVAAGAAAMKPAAANEKRLPSPMTGAATLPASTPANNPPAWINQPPQMLGDTYQTTIVVGPYATPQECEDELPGELHKAANRYVATYVGRPAGAQLVALPYEFLRNEVVKDKWEEIGPSSVGPMTRLYVLLQFDRKAREQILEEYRRGVVAGRLWIAGGGLAAVLWLLAVTYGYLRIDLKTSGKRRRRLRFAAILAILGPVAVALLATVVK